MENLKLIRPTIEYKDQVLETVKEFEDNNSNLYWVWWLKRFLDNYKWWLNLLKNNENKNTVEPWRVIAKQFLLVRESDDRLLWFINTRLEINDRLLVHGWHIWYAIRPSERRKNYATAQLFSVLDIYDEIGVEKVLLTCDKTNVWSTKTIQKCGWILENEIIDPVDWELIKRFWIDVDKWIKMWDKFFESVQISIKKQ